MSTPGAASGAGNNKTGSTINLTFSSSMASHSGIYSGSAYVYGLFTGGIIIKILNVPLHLPVFTLVGVVSKCVAYGDMVWGAINAYLTYTFTQYTDGSQPNTNEWKVQAYVTGDAPGVPTGAILSDSGPLPFTGGQIFVTQPIP